MEYGGEKKTTVGEQKIALAEEVGLGGERVRIGQGTWKMEVKVAVAGRDRLKWQEGMENKSTLEKYRSKQEILGGGGGGGDNYDMYTTIRPSA